MLTRHSAVALTLLLCLAGCAGNTEPGAASGESSDAPTVSSSVSPSTPATSPSKPAASRSSTTTASGAETITGTVEAGVEPNCRLIKDNTGSYLLVLKDPSLRALAGVGRKITATGRSDPKLMSTCQQGIPFIVTAISPA